VRFGELKGLTSLPIHRVRDHFRYEEVLTVLPVRDAITSREILLVATRPALASLAVLPVPRGHWMSRWTAWNEVAISIPEAPLVQDEEDHRLIVTLGRQQLYARLQGEMGRRALRDFVVAVRTAQPTPTG
jgi:hypothetical protein